MSWTTIHDLPDTTVIWRYYEYIRFVEVLDSRTLWFSRLNSWPDPDEGRSAYPSKSHLIIASEEHARKGCACCWTINIEESEYMWGNYAPKEGVAIQSTIGRLTSAIQLPERSRVILRPIEYGTDWAKGPPEAYALLKRDGFQQELELRAYLPYEYEFDRNGARVEPTTVGRQVHVDLSSLMTGVWVNPNSEEPFRETVEKELAKHFLSGIPVKNSHGTRVGR